MEIRSIGGREMHDHAVVKRREKKFLFVFLHIPTRLGLCMYLAELGLSFGMRDLNCGLKDLVP